MIARAGRWLIAVAALIALPAQGAGLMMVRSSQQFPETMLQIQEAIDAQGYTLSRVQRVDVGLDRMGYETDKYRVVFFARPEEVRRLRREHSSLIPFMPLKLAVFAEGDDTLVVGADPAWLARGFDDPELAPIFERWHEDIQAILDKVSGARASP